MYFLFQVGNIFPDVGFEIIMFGLANFGWVLPTMRSGKSIYCIGGNIYMQIS